MITNRKLKAITISSALLLLLVPTILLTTTTTSKAFAQTIPEDDNGISLTQALSGYTYTYGNVVDSTEFYDDSPYFEFAERDTNGNSKRMQWTGHSSHDRFNTGMIAGFFNLSPNDVCATDPNEEISPKLNGGPHNDVNPTWADTMDMGTGFDLDDTDGPGSPDFGAAEDSRVRWEETHPGLSDEIYTEINTALPVTGTPTTMCDVPGGWVGLKGFKVNLDVNCNEIIDNILLEMFVDRSGLNTDQSPKNNWQRTYKHSFALSEIDLKGKARIYVDYTLDMPEEAYATMRIDMQDSGFQHQYMSYHKITAVKNPSGCPAGITEAAASGPNNMLGAGGSLIPVSTATTEETSEVLPTIEEGQEIQADSALAQQIEETYDSTLIAGPEGEVIGEVLSEEDQAAAEEEIMQGELADPEQFMEGGEGATTTTEEQDDDTSTSLEVEEEEGQ